MVFDSSAAGAPRPALAALADNLRPGEVFSVLRGDRILATVTGDAVGEDTQAPRPWLQSLVRRLPAARLEGPLQALATLPGGLQLRLQGDLARVDRQLAATASRYSIYFAALAGAIGLAWLIVEMGLLHRMALLTRRASALSVELQRAREHLRREQLRAHQEREQWQAVGHEIMSPLQSLLALHGDAGDGSRRYLERMQAALHLLYGQASVGEAMVQASAQSQRVDIAAFLQQVADNAPHAGVDGVVAIGCGAGCDVVADQGPRIPDERLATLFELGTSDRAQPGQRGQG